MKLNIHLIFAALFKFLQQQCHNLRNLFLVQGMEDDDLINSVQELRLEDPLHLFHDIALHTLIILLLILSCQEAQLLRFLNCCRTGIRCHNQNGVLKIHLSSLGVRDMTIIQYLQ